MAGSRRIPLGLALLVVASSSAVSADSVHILGEGMTITAVELRADVTASNVSRAREFLDLTEGEPLTADSVRQALLNLQGSGLVSEVEIFTRLDGTGVAVVVAAWSNVLVDSVSFEGNLRLREHELRDLCSVRVRSPLIESQVLRSVYDVADRYVEEGYLVARVRAAVDVDERRKLAQVVLRIDEGERAMVGKISLSGELGPVDPLELEAAMESRRGGRYWPKRVRRDTDNLRRFLIGRGYRMSRVGVPVEQYDDEQHVMNLLYEIELGPRVEFEVIGADLKTLVKEGLLPFLSDQGYDHALLSFSVRRVTSWYQSEGYYNVRVETTEETSDELIQVTMAVEPGELFRLQSLAFEGNETLDSETLVRLMATSERRFMNPASGRLVDETLAEDLVNLRSYYALQGFGGAVVGPVRVDETPGALALTIPIEEGLRRRVGKVHWKGNTVVSSETLAANLAIRPGGPFHQNLLEESLNELRSRYRDLGFDRALVSLTVAWDAAQDVADVTFQVLEGEQTVVRRVVVRGLQVTSPWVLRRAIDLETGDSVSRSQLSKIQRRLYGLGIFTSVQVSLAHGAIVGGERDVVVELVEGDRHRVSVGGGFDTESGPRGLFGYSLGNLAGRGAALHIDAIVARREELFRLLVTQPALGGWRLPLQYSIFRTREEEVNLASGTGGQFITEETGAQIQANLQARGFRLPLIYTYKKVDNNASDEIDEIIFDRERAKVKISSFTAAIQVDRRDSPINATRGRNTLIQGEYAFPVLSAEESFFKLFLQQTQYFNLGSAGIVGASLRLGGIESFRADDGEVSPAGEDCSADPIPDFGVALSERFFAGGRSTHRAYRLDALGITGQTRVIRRQENEAGICEDVGALAVGGKGLVLFNLDYRYPVLPGIWAIAFFDSGNVWADWRDISTSDLKQGVGVGALWESPIGPLRLEIGWKLDREEFEDPYRIFFSFGTAF